MIPLLPTSILSPPEKKIAESKRLPKGCPLYWIEFKKSMVGHVPCSFLLLY